jgi:hypothetical protein
LREATRRVGWVLILSLVAGVAYLYLNLFSLPRTPYLLSGDQVYFWMDAQRMLDGGRIYQDFFQFTPPGADLVYLAMFKAFGLNVWVTNAVVLVLGVVLCWLCFALASELMERRSALLATALFLVLIYGKLMNATHHLFSALAILIAVKICMRATTAVRIVIAGGLLGVASFFTQTHGVAALLAFAVFLVWKRVRSRESWTEVLRQEGLLLLGFAAALALLSAHFLAAVGWRELWYFQVTYARRFVVYSLHGSFLGLPDSFGWHALPMLAPYLVIYLMIAIVYPVALRRCWQRRHDPLFPWEKVALLSTVGFFLLVEVCFRLNWLRLFSVAMPAVILFVFGLDEMPRVRRCAAVVMYLGMFCLVARQTLLSVHVHSQTIELPGGVVVVTPQMYEKLRWMTLHTQPGDYFFQAPWPGMYLPLRLRNPLFVDQILAGEGTRPEEIALAIQQLEMKRVQYVLWARRLDDTGDLPIGMRDNVAPLREYLHGAYGEEKTFPDGDEVWKRKESAGLNR